MNKNLLLTALALAAWMGVGTWSVCRLLDPAFQLDFLRLLTLC